MMVSATLQSGTAAQALPDSPLPLLRSLSVTESENEITLSGFVDSYYFKQLAQEAILPYLGQRRLRNQVVVRPDGVTRRPVIPKPPPPVGGFLLFAAWDSRPNPGDLPHLSCHEFAGPFNKRMSLVVPADKGDWNDDSEKPGHALAGDLVHPVRRLHFI